MIFIERYSQQTINDGLQILQDNLKRETTNEVESIEKFTLSLSIVNYLKACSVQP